MYLWEDYDADPSQNVAPPPLGAPENTTKLKAVNEIDRRMMAAISEIGTWVQDRFATLGSMADQNSADVHITGGFITGGGTQNIMLDDTTLQYCGIGSTNAIDGGAIKSGSIDPARLPVVSQDANTFRGMTSQQWYNFLHPVGAVLMTTAKTATIALPTGVAATWTIINTTRYPRGIDWGSYTGTPSAIQTGGAQSVATSQGGVHDHFGNTGNTVLSLAQIPAHTHPIAAGGRSPATQDTGYGSDGTVDNNQAQQSGSAGGGAGHNHVINEHPGHTHSVNLDVFWFAVLIWVRTA